MIQACVLLSLKFIYQDTFYFLFFKDYFKNVQYKRKVD